MARIPLRNRAGEVVAETIVDNADYAALSAWGWRRNNYGYAVRCERGEDGRTVLMHRHLLGLEFGDPLFADHENRDRLDNRRANLRRVTRPQQQQNLPSSRGSTSRFRGVSWVNARQCWVAQACVAGQRRFLGHFDSELDAARAALEFRAEHMPFAVEL